MHVERQVLFWLAMAVLLGLAVLALKAILLPFVTALIIAYALNPLAERFVAVGFPRAAAAALIIGLLLATLLVALVFLVPVLLAQIQQSAEALPGEFERLRSLLDIWARGALGANYADFSAALDTATGDQAPMAAQ